MTSIQDFITQATSAPVSLPVRELLSIWGYRARTYESVARIDRDLSAAGLHCVPGLNDGASDSLIQVGIPAAATPSGDESPDEDTTTGADEPLQLPPVAPIIRDIPSATGGVMSVSPDDSLGKAQALMTGYDFSQLAVMANEWDLHGAVSWQSIAKAGLAHGDPTLKRATMSEPTVVAAKDHLLSKIDLIYQHDFVFVREEDRMISGIVTTADLTRRFRDLTSPFFELGEIERRLRRCIDRVFTPEQLRAATGNRRLNSADGMVFGEYKRVLDNTERWRDMGWTRYDCATFIGFLEEARKVRNRIMHFGEELGTADVAALTHCLNFMRALDRPLES